MVCFFSDNGGPTSNGSWNGPFSGVKGTLREGGVRIPMIWSWPDGCPAKPNACRRRLQPRSFADLFGGSRRATVTAVAAARYEDKRNRKKAVKKYGPYDGHNLLPQLQGEGEPSRRTLFWRLQGQTSILDGDDKLITLSHRPAQMFRPEEDLGERVDRFEIDSTRANELYQMLGQWESSLATVPLWGSSPYWIGQSAKQYDTYEVRVEPE